MVPRMSEFYMLHLWCSWIHFPCHGSKLLLARWSDGDTHCSQPRRLFARLMGSKRGRSVILGIDSCFILRVTQACNGPRGACGGFHHTFLASLHAGRPGRVSSLAPWHLYTFPNKPTGTNRPANILKPSQPIRYFRLHIYSII